MEKLDYSDINKFLASLGVVLIGVSFLLPYLYLKEDFGFLIKVSDFNNLLPITQNIVLTKQYFLDKLQIIIPFLSLITLISGITSFYIGIKRWNSNQGKLNKKLDTEIEKLSYETLSLRPLSDKEKKDKIIEEEVGINKNKENTNQLKNTSSLSSFINDALDLEKEIEKTYTKFNDDDYEILYQQKIGNKFNLDILLKSLNKKYVDGIIEIKYLRNSHGHLGIGLNRILDAINTYAGYYSNVTKKETVPILLVVIEDGENQGEIIKNNIKEKLTQYSSGIPSLENLIIEILYKSELSKYTPLNVFTEIKRISKKVNLGKALKKIEQEFANQ